MEEDEEREERDGIKRETSEAREREIERTRSQGCYYSCGTGSGGAGESRRIAPRRVVRLGYQMVRTSSRCTVRLYHRARGTSRECNGGVRAVSYAVAARLRTTLVSPNYLVLVVRSGDRKLTAPRISIALVLKRHVTRPERGRAKRTGEETKEHSFAIST